MIILVNILLECLFQHNETEIPTRWVTCVIVDQDQHKEWNGGAFSENKLDLID